MPRMPRLLEPMARIPKYAGVDDYLIDSALAAYKV